jgi:hypothetical protein
MFSASLWWKTAENSQTRDTENAEGRVITITPDGNVTTVLKAEKPWAPSGVAIRSDEVYVLEHINPNSEAHEDWPPRVRKLGRDGKVTTLATITRK